MSCFSRAMDLRFLDMHAEVAQAILRCRGESSTPVPSRLAQEGAPCEKLALTGRRISVFLNGDGSENFDLHAKVAQAISRRHGESIPPSLDRLTCDVEFPDLALCFSRPSDFASFSPASTLSGDKLCQHRARATDMTSSRRRNMPRWPFKDPAVLMATLSVADARFVKHGVVCEASEARLPHVLFVSIGVAILTTQLRTVNCLVTFTIARTVVLYDSA